MSLLLTCDRVKWANEQGQRLHVHGYESRQWRHLDTCQLKTVIDAEVPRVLDPETGKTHIMKIPRQVRAADER